MTRKRYTIDDCAIVLLAAGKSSRLGSPKQLLAYKGKNLLLHAVEIAVETSLKPIVIVVGANRDAMKNQLKDWEVEIAENNGWEEGIASSLHCGLNAVLQIKPTVDGIIFIVCDQPFVTASLLKNLLAVQHDTGLPIVASAYEDNLGTPAFFHKSLFPELMELKGDTGARKLIKQHEDLVATVSFPKGIVDIDTAADYEILKRSGI